MGWSQKLVLEVTPSRLASVTKKLQPAVASELSDTARNVSLPVRLLASKPRMLANHRPLAAS